MPLIAIIGLFFIAATMLLFVLMYAFVPKKTVLEERLESMTPAAEAAEYGTFQKPPSGFQKFLGRLGGKVRLRPQDYGKYTRDLVAAGIRKEMMPVLLGAKVFLMLVLPGIYLLIYGLPVEIDQTRIILASAILAIIGFLIPSYWLRIKKSARQLRIFHDLPDVLDLMTVCVEAGLSMDSAILKISEDKQFKDSPLSKELNQATQETRAGKPRREALQDMAARTMLDDMRSFTTMLIQTEQLGTSLADALRIYSESLRTIRRQKAEEAAAKTAIKLLFPLVFLIMPAMFVVMLLPALLRLTRFFSSI